MNTTNEITVKASTTKELAAMYGISAKTFRTWLQPHQKSIGEKVGRYYSVLQIRIIFDKLGYPG